MRGLEGLFGPILDRRLRAESPAPLAVAFSGGGDSLALLLLARAWADRHGRRVIALTVDHGLNPASAEWTERCRATAARLGVEFRALAWTGEKPATGLPAAARAARHDLLADAARAAGARVLLMGHTADDLAEAAAMRAAGSTVGDPREWAPSPAWPQGRGVFLLRPLLGMRRPALRDWLAGQDETWIDDPANEDARFARTRARSALTEAGKGTGEAGGGDPADEGGSAPSAPPRRVPLPTAWGGLVLDRCAPPSHIAAACLCAGGTSRPPRGARLARLVERLRAGQAFVATLAGARVEASGETAVFLREPAREGLPILPLPVGEPVVWDGRFELLADRPGLAVRGLAGLAARLPRAERAGLRGIPPAARRTLPAVTGADEFVTCPILAGERAVRCRALVLDRFEAATGGVDSEPAP
ncbi:MAG: tRNA lysidine(34) synthetase TilS [Pseudomonadota bacterium]